MLTRIIAAALALCAPLACGAAAARPGAPAAAVDQVAAHRTALAAERGATVQVTIPSVLVLSVVSQTRSADGCHVVIVVTDSRAERPGFTVSAVGGGTGSVQAEQIAGNAMSAADVVVRGTEADYPAGAGRGSVRLTGTFATCPSWTLV